MRRALRSLLSRRWVWVGGSILSPIVLVALVLLYLWEDQRGKNAWTNYRDTMRTRGAPIELVDFTAGAIPDDENFATVTFFAEAFQNPSAPVERRAFYLPPRKSPMPPLSSLDRCERTALSEWQSYFVEMNFLEAASSDAAADVLRAIDSRFGAAWTDLEAGSKRSGCRFPVRWEQAFLAEMPHLTILSEAGRIGALRVSAHLALGRRDLAMADLETLLRTYHHCRPDPVSFLDWFA